MNRAIVEKRINSATEERSITRNSWLVAPGVWRLKDLFVNVYFIQDEEAKGWVMVDAGLQTTANKARELVTELFGKSSLPKAIILTHAHFDHRGSLLELAEEWGVPVYCHRLEKPYLTGQASYPPPDPSVGGGVLSLMSFTFPRSPINAAYYLEELPANGSINELKEWKWIHTPGHTAGHVSLFREKDGVLISGDAVVTTMQESLLAVATQKKWVCGPPKYFTPDWSAAARSVKELASLEPNVIASGHGQAMYGDEARKELHKLAKHFWRVGIPAKGRYVKEPVLYDADGQPEYIPRSRGRLWKKIAFSAALLAVGYLLSRRKKMASGTVEKLVLGKMSSALKSAAMLSLGATAPPSPALPNVPLIPAV